MTPSYANLFMGKFEQAYITTGNPFVSKIKLYRRYIDYLFFLWLGMEEKARLFADYINRNSWGITLTPNYQEETIEFLDLNISYKDESYVTSAYFKKVEANSFLNFSSGHFHKWKNIPYGQFRQIRTNCTEDLAFQKEARILKRRFKEEDYPEKLVQDAYEKIKNVSEDKCQTMKQRPSTDTITLYSKF